jgi:5-carboxymethyl-2-hydroxymuconic-semialdehyde dehydrogenase
VDTRNVDSKHWIGGKRVDSPATFPDLSPIDGTVIADIARGGAIEVDVAVAAARAAFPCWAGTSRAERARVLHAVADGVERRIDELAALEAADSGSVVRWNRGTMMPRVVRNFRFFADWLTNSLGHPDFHTDGHENHVTWEPAGVCALITPWNAPLMLASWKVAPALAAGNSVVLKPAEWSPLTASLLADIAAEAGLPDGVLNVLQGYGDEVGALLVEHPDLDRISFTGSVATGRLVAAAAGANLTPVRLELGGKSPLLVFADADLNLAVDIAVGQYANAGQFCLAASRVLVDAAIADEFTERFVARGAELRQGDPRDEQTDVGPQIHPEHFARVDGFVLRSLAGGATALLGGGPNADLGGLYYQPTLLTGMAEGAEILTEEVFGPVLTLQTFDTEEQAVAMANGTRFGLCAVVLTGDRDQARRVSGALAAGTVWVNCFYVRDLRAPFGGVKESGIGREGGTWSFDFFCDVKNTVTRH